MKSFRPESIKDARLVYLQSAPWTPIQRCLAEVCDEYDGLKEQYDALKQERDRLAMAAVRAQDHLHPSHAAYGIIGTALNPASGPHNSSPSPVPRDEWNSDCWKGYEGCRCRVNTERKPV